MVGFKLTVSVRAGCLRARPVAAKSPESRIERRPVRGSNVTMSTSSAQRLTRKEASEAESEMDEPDQVSTKMTQHTINIQYDLSKPPEHRAPLACRQLRIVRVQNTFRVCPYYFPQKCLYVEVI